MVINVRNTNLFDNINDNFFNLLSSGSNNRLYSGSLLEIYDIFEQEISFRIKRDIVRDTLSTYIMSEDFYSDSDEFDSVNEYANSIIRKFYDSGWLIEEIDDVTYEKQVVMTEKGIALAEFLIHLIRPPKTEYSSYVFNIYNLLHNRTQYEKNPYAQGLRQVYRDSKQLANSLKKLSTSIKNIIEEVVEEETFEDLTKNLVSYCEGSFIKEYSRLVNEHNIRIYRKAIINKLNELRDNSDVYELMCIDCFCNENLETQQEAESFVFEMLRKTISFLTDDYDHLMNDIQKKINIYLNLAVGRARFLLNHDDNARGNVNQVIKLLIENSESNIEDDISSLFNIYTQEFIDMASLRYPRTQKTITKPAETEVPVMTDEDIERAREIQRKEAYNPYSKESMKRFVSNMMGNKTEISAGDFPVNVKEDMLSVVSSAVYSEENGFVLTAKDNYITKNGFIIRDFTISLGKDHNSGQT